MAASEGEGLRMKSSIRKSWIKQLSERYSTRIDEIVEEDCGSAENENLESKDASGSSVSTEHTDDPGSKTSSENTECDVWSEHGEYRVEVVGGTNPPPEWQHLNGRKQSATCDSISSGDMDNSVEKDLVGDDSWKLIERDNEILEVDMRKETGELKDASLASDEESLMRTPLEQRKKQTTTSSKAKRISSPTTYPSNFTTIRTGKATEMFTERMKSIEQKNKAKTKSKMAPVVATIGRFSSAFRRFEGKEERSRSLDGSLPAMKAQQSAVSVSTNDPTSNKTKLESSKTQEPKRLPRTPFDHSFSTERLQTEIESKKEKESPTRLVRTPVDTCGLASTELPPGKSSRAATLPVGSSRLMRNVRESGNAPDVVAGTFQPDREEKPAQGSPRSSSMPLSPVRTDSHVGKTEKELEQLAKFEELTSRSRSAGQPGASAMHDQMRLSREQTNPHFDIDIVIKRDPLPDTMSPEDFSREPPTTAITLGREEVTVMKIDSHNQGSSVTPSEVITVWDTEVPVRERHEKVIPPTKLHVTHLNKGVPLRLNAPTSPEQEQPRSRSPTNFTSQIKASSTDNLLDRKERQLRHRTANQIQAEPVMVKIRPQPVQQWHNPARDFRRSKSHEDQLDCKQRSSIALEPEDLLKLAASEKAKQRTQLTSSERAIPKRRPVTYNAPYEEPEMIIQHRQRQQYSQQQSNQQHSRLQRMSSPPRPTYNPTQDSLSSQSHERPLLYSQEQPPRRGHQPNREMPLSYERTPRDRTQLEFEEYNDPMVQRPVNEKMKSNSLDDLRMLREGLVANTKAVFSTTREPGKQYFGEHVAISAPKRPPMPAEDTNYTREWVENSKHTSVTTTKRGQRQSPVRQSPAREEKKDRSWFIEKQAQSPTRLAGGAHRRRTRSLGRATTKSKAIVQMAKFFQDEAELGATHRDASPIDDDVHSSSAFEQVMPSVESQTANSRASLDDLHSPRSTGHWRSSNAKPATSKSLPRFKGDKPQRGLEVEDERRVAERPASKSGGSGIGDFIDIYNERDAESRHISEIRGPRKSLIVREERMSQSKVKQTATRSKSMDVPVVRVNDEPAEESIDDRPLAASAFKAWLGSDTLLQSPLEQKVEQAYQTHMRMDKGHKIVSSSEQRHKALTRTEKPKAEPWWKQQNEIASQRRVTPEPNREDKNAVTESFARTEHFQQQHQLHTSRVNDPPYANYQAQVEGYRLMEVQKQNQVEDYYAQIRKKPVDHTQSLPADTNEDQQLFVNVAPPKPERSSTYQSNNSLDGLANQQAPELPQRHEVIAATQMELLHAPADNRMYYDPYVTPEQPTNQPALQYNSQPRPSSADPYERSYLRGDNYHYLGDERTTPYVEQQEAPNLPRENRLYQRQDVGLRPHNEWDQRGQPYSHWQGAPVNQPPANDYQWSRDPQPDWRTTEDTRRQPEQRHTQPVREWQMARQDPRYNTWSDREHGRSRPIQSDLRPHDTLPRTDTRSHSYRMANPSTRSLEKQRMGDPRPDVLPADKNMDKRSRRARSVPITRPPQQKTSKGGEGRQTKPKGSGKHDQKPSRQDRSEERPSKSSKPKDKAHKHRGHKDVEPKHKPQTAMLADTSPLPDFIPSHYFNEREYNGPDQSSFIPQGSQYMTSHPEPQMAYNQQMYNQQPPRVPYSQPTNQMPHNQPAANQLPYSRQPTNQMSYNQHPNNQIPYSRQPTNQVIPSQQPANDSGYTKHTAFTTYADRPRPGVGVMFNPLVGATDF